MSVGARCRPNVESLAKKVPHPERIGHRRGTIIGETTDGTCWIIRWDDKFASEWKLGGGHLRDCMAKEDVIVEPNKASS